MAFISETLQMRRLTESGVNIKTTYIVDGTLRYRSTDANLQDDVHSGIRCRKEYFRQGKLLHTEKIFDSRMEYTYVSGMDEEAQHTCENCGFTGKVKEFVNGCPCCDAASNIDYADKELGSKHHYDLVLQKSGLPDRHGSGRLHHIIPAMQSVDHKYLQDLQRL